MSSHLNDLDESTEANVLREGSIVETVSGVSCMHFYGNWNGYNNCVLISREM